MALPFTQIKLAVKGKCPVCNKDVTEFKIKAVQPSQAGESMNRDVFILCCSKCLAKTSDGKVATNPVRFITYSSIAPNGKYYCPNGCDVTSNVRGTCPICNARLVAVTF